MPETAAVTVGIPTYARGERVLTPLEKILSCDPVPAEIIVHLDAGDGTLGKKITERFPMVRLLLSSKLVGPGGGRHRCLLEATQPCFASFDDDSWPMNADYFERIVTHFEHSPEIAGLAALVFRRGQDAAPSTPATRDVVDFTGCGHALRTSAYRALPGYVDRPIAYGLEERDVALQLHAAGARLLECRDLRVFHDTDLRHPPARPEVTTALIENAALLPWLRYPMPLWPFGFLQYMNLIWFLLREGRWSGIMTGILRSPVAVWNHRHLRQPLEAAAVQSYLEKRDRLPRNC